MDAAGGHCPWQTNSGEENQINACYQKWELNDENTWKQRGKPQILESGGWEEEGDQKKITIGLVLGLPGNWVTK